jgi:hypothetical protein
MTDAGDRDLAVEIAALRDRLEWVEESILTLASALERAELAAYPPDRPQRVSPAPIGSHMLSAINQIRLSRPTQESRAQQPVE